MTDDQLEELWALIGNVIRITAAVEPGDAKTAADAAERARLHAILLEPRLSPISPRDHKLNHKLLQAFVDFRMDIELIRAAPNEAMTEQ